MCASEFAHRKLNTRVYLRDSNDRGASTTLHRAFCFSYRIGGVGLDGIGGAVRLRLILLLTMLAVRFHTDSADV